MKIISSPNYNDRPDGAIIDTIVIHYTGMKTAKDALAKMLDIRSKVSAHYMIYENGDVVQLVDEKHRAWHAGISSLRGRNNVNDFSIGIELVNPGHEFGYRKFPEEQMEALIILCKEIFSRNPIKRENVIGHSEIAPNRKEDPGELFNWDILTKNGLCNIVRTYA